MSFDDACTKIGRDKEALARVDLVGRCEHALLTHIVVGRPVIWHAAIWFERVDRTNLVSPLGEADVRYAALASSPVREALQR